jgi:hypothetical protein
MTPTRIQDFATRYAAWSGQSAAAVASFFAPEGSLRINGGPPSIGREAITAVAQSFMTAFPDLIVVCDRLEIAGGQVRFHWTLTGTNTGPGGTGQRVHISGFEEWTLDDNGLIAASDGSFDEADYRRQLQS